MVATYFISLLAHAAALACVSAALGYGYLAGNPWVLLAVVVGLVVLAWLPLVVRELFRRLRQAGSRGQTPLWALPLAQLTTTVAATLTGLWIPVPLGRADFWRDALDVSPGPFTDLIVLWNFVLLGGALLTFALLCFEWIRHRMVRELQGPSPPTRLALALGAVALPLLLVLLAIAPPANVEYLLAWRAYSWDRDTGRALAGFEKLAGPAGRGQLADNSLMRIALIHRELGHPAEALEALRQLRERFPMSPLVDDATYWSGRILLGQGDLAAARRELLQVVERWPRSCLADDALLALYESARERRDPEAARLALRIRTDYPFSYAEVERGGGKPRFVRTSSLVTETTQR